MRRIATIAVLLITLAAWPVAIQGGISFVALWVRWSTEMLRPAASRFGTSLR